MKDEDQIQKEIFAKNLNFWLEVKHKNQMDLMNDLNLSSSTVSDWCNAKKYPRMGTVQMLADYLHILKSDLIEDKSNQISTISIPILGIVKAGYDYLAEENIVDYIRDYSAPDPENYYAVYVRGDSMDPIMSDGDIAIVHKQEDFESGNTCIVLINGDEATVKKVIKTDDGIDLIAANPYYPKRHFTKAEMKSTPVQIIGRVRESRKRNAFE